MVLIRKAALSSFSLFGISSRRWLNLPRVCQVPRKLWAVGGIANWQLAKSAARSNCAACRYAPWLLERLPDRLPRSCPIILIQQMSAA